MKQLLPFLLLLLPCLAWAQYPSNGNQKITLGEQTSADGLIWRGVATDTTLTVKSDTAAYFVLDTANLNLYTYKVSATGKKWIQLSSDTTSLNLVSRFAAKLNIGDTATMLTPYFRKLDTLNIRYVNTYGTQTVNGAKTFSSTITGARFNPTSSTASGTGMYLPKTNTLGFTSAGNTRFAIAPRGLSIFKSDTVQNKYTASGMIEIGAQGVIFSATGTPGLYDDYSFGLGYTYDIYGNPVYMSTTNTALTHQPARVMLYQGEFLFDNAVAGTKDDLLTWIRLMTINKNGYVGIGTSSPQVQFHTTGGVRFATFAGGGTTTLSVDNNGDLGRTSSIELKNNITNIKYGLSDILKINPINFNWKDENKFGNENENGFIAEDVYTIIPNVVSSDNNGIFMDYTKLIPILTKAIQEQTIIIKQLEERIKKLEER